MSAPQLTLQSLKVGNVVVIRCQGRIVTGEEVRILQQEIEKLTVTTKKVVLHLAQVTYVDSGGLGALVRMSGMLRAGHGGLILCQLSPFVRQVLEATTLLRVFQIYSSETEALQSFSARSHSPEVASAEPRTRVVCFDTSHDLLAFISVLLKRSGYEVFTSSILSDVRTLVKATRPSILICGPGMGSNAVVMERIRQIDSKIPLLQLPSDFSTTEAHQSGGDLVDRLRSLLKS